MSGDYRNGSRNGLIRILVFAVIFLLPLGIMIWHLVRRILHILAPLMR